MTNREWLQSILPNLDGPENFIPDMNSYAKKWEDFPNHVKFCLTALTPYAAMVANLGFAIMYDIMNAKMEDVICERFYYPEPKLERRHRKENRPFFSLETQHDLKDFDVLGFSSYYPLQMFGVPDILESSGMSAFTKDRKDTDPFVLFAGIAAFNASPIYNMVDMIFIGEGEEVIKQIITIIKKHKGKPGWKLEAKKELCVLPGCYVPEFYDETYFPADDPKHPNQVKDHFPIVPWAPKVVVKATVDFKNIEPTTRTFVANSDGLDMAVGAVQISTGCSNRCAFCSGSFNAAPYRERPYDMIESSFDQIVKNTGTHAVVPYSFNLSDHSCIIKMIEALCNDSRLKVQMSSQRIDYFDAAYADLSRQSGTRRITFAIEGGSQRMRCVINKNLTEVEILKAFETAFKHDFSSIKIYMILGLPFETPEDLEAILPLMQKILALKGGKSCKIRISYTPFQSKSQTPFQWAPMLPVYKKEDVGKVIHINEGKGEVAVTITDEMVGAPIIDKRLMDVKKKLNDMGIMVRVSANSKFMAVNQAVSLGDRRMAAILYEAYKTGAVNYGGGMSLGKDPHIAFLQVMKKHGLDYGFFFREKDEDEVFSWDLIDCGVSKEFMLDAWRLAKWQSKRTVAGEETPNMGTNPVDHRITYLKGKSEKDRKLGGIPPCWVACTHCGCCGKDSKVHHIDFPDHKLDKSAAEVLQNKKTFKPNSSMILRLWTHDQFRFVHNSKVKMYLNRSLVRFGLQPMSPIQIQSDNIEVQNWVSGLDVALVNLYESEKDWPDFKKLVEFINKDAWIFKCISASGYDPTKLKVSASSSFYYMTVNRDFAVKTGLVGKVKALETAEHCPVAFKVKGPARDILVTRIEDIKGKSYDIFAFTEELEDDVTVYMKIPNIITPYDFMASLLGTSRRNVLRYLARRVAYVGDAGSMAMLLDSCVVCGNTADVDLVMDEGVEPSKMQFLDNHCLRHFPHATSEERVRLRPYFDIWTDPRHSLETYGPI